MKTLDDRKKRFDLECKRREAFKSKERSMHPTILTKINGTEVEIDVEILPMVNWLNSLSGVKTQFSCQGEVYPENPYCRPRILFFCEEHKIIEKIAQLAAKFKSDNDCKSVMSFFEVEIQAHWYVNRMRYVLIWYDLLVLQDFISWMKVQK